MIRIRYRRTSVKRPRRDVWGTLRVGPRAPSVTSIPVNLATIEPLVPEGPIVPTRTVRLGARMTFHGHDWLINDKQHHHDAPIKVGELQIWELVNETGMDHPFHLHGFFFQVVAIDGAPVVPTVLRKDGPVTTVEALTSIPCVTLGAGPTRWQFETIKGPKAIVVEGRLRTNNMLALRDAALAGLGIAQLPRWMIVDELKSKRLVRILEDAALPTVSVLGLVHADARHSNTLRLVQDFLAAELPRGVREPIA